MILSVKEATDELKELLLKEKLCLFAGSGVSVDSGLPTWDGLIDVFIEISEKYNERLPAHFKFDSILNDAKNCKDKYPIRTISVLKNKILECEKMGQSIDFYVNRLQKLFLNANFNEVHELVVGTKYKYILTSNYDDLFEMAADNLSINDLALSSYSYEQIDLISQALYEEKTAIIHVHGRASNINIGKFVLTSDDYHKIRRQSAGFRQIINDIFIHYSILFIGYGGSDPHLEEVIEEINMALNWNQATFLNLPNYYIVLKKDKVDSVLSEYKKNNRTKIIMVNDYDESKQMLKDLRNIAPRV